MVAPITRLVLVGLVALTIAPRSTIAQAQVTADGTLPTGVTSPNGLDFTINGGGRSGGNLFHSFRQFSVPTNGVAVFNNATDVQNIFSRVTGGTASNIDGTIRANGTANLFLLNPSGILFGANASLNIGGSFVGTTARSIQFADGMEFSATNLTDRPLLTMRAPIGLQMGQNPGAITVHGNGHQMQQPLNGRSSSTQTGPATDGLQVLAGKTLALVGSNITLKGGELTAPSGRIELGAVVTGIIGLTPASQGFALDYGNVTNFGNLQLLQKSLVNVSGQPAGSIQLQGRHLSVQDGSVIWSQNRGATLGGNITLRGTDRVELLGTVPNPTQTDPTSIITLELTGTGTGGDIQISTRQLHLLDGGSIQSRSFSPNPAGYIYLNATESIQIARNTSNTRGGISTQTTLDKGGDIVITTPKLEVLNGGVIGTVTNGRGVGGDLTINTDQMVVDGATANRQQRSIVSTTTLGPGSSGKITINTRTLHLSNSGTVNSVSSGSGNAGIVTVNATESVTVTGWLPGVMLPSRINASVFEIPPSVRQAFGIPGTTEDLVGNAGGITINTPSLTVTDQGEINVTHAGTGNGGTILINADTVRLRRQGQFTASTTRGAGGNITVNANTLLLRDGSSITTAADLANQGSQGNAGNISLNVPVILGLDNSDIIANAPVGRGGKINIATQSIIGLEFHNTRTPRTDPTNDITASFGIGLDGTVQINHIGVDPNSGLVALPVDIVDPSQQISKGCNAAQGGSFVATGRGGIPNNPSQTIDIDRPWSDLRSIEPTGTTTATNPTQTPQFGEATTWAKDPQTGQIQILAAQPWANASIATCGAIDAPN